MEAPTTGRFRQHTYAAGHESDRLGSSDFLRFLPSRRERSSLMSPDCPDCHASQTTSDNIQSLQPRRSHLSGLLRRRSRKNLLPTAGESALCHECGEQYDAEDDRRKRELDQYNQLRQMIRDELSFNSSKSEHDLPSSECSDASSNSESLLSDSDTPLDLTSFVPFSLVDDERWGTGMSATLPFLPSAEKSSPRDLSCHQNHGSTGTPPPDHVSYGETKPTSNKTQKPSTASPNRPLSQEEYEKATGMIRHDSALGLSWRSDVGAWEKVIATPRARGDSTGSAASSVSDSRSQSDNGAHGSTYDLVSPMECPPTSTLPLASSPHAAHATLPVQSPPQAAMSLLRIDPLASNPPDPSDVPSQPSSRNSSPLTKKRSRVSFSTSVSPSIIRSPNHYTYIDKVPSILPPRSRSSSPLATTNTATPTNANIAGLEKSLYRAVYSGDLEKAQQLLRMDTPPDIVHANQGILAAAAMWGHAAVGQAMAEHVIDPKNGKCAICSLSAIDFRKDVDIVRALLKHGIDPKWSGGLCGCPLGTAAWMGKVEIVRVLLEHGADVTQCGGKYKHVLCSAAAEAGFSGNLGVVKVLVKAGAKVSAFGPQGNAMSLAMKRRDFWLAKAEERPHLAEVESRIASCDLMVRYLDRAENELRIKLADALSQVTGTDSGHEASRAA